MRRPLKASSVLTNHTGSRVGISAAVLLSAVLALLALAPLASASKTVHAVLGNTSTFPSGNALDGGLFSGAKGIGVNASGAGGAGAGDVYVANSDAHRIDQISADGEFIRAFGRDVIESGKANDDGAGYEICDATVGNAVADCKEGAGFPAEGGTLASPEGVAVNQVTGHVYVTDSQLLRVSEFDATGHFVRAFGQDVSTTGSTDFEVCSIAAGCQSGVSASSAGAFGEYFNGRLAVAPATAPDAGNVIVADPGNRRVNEYTAAGAFVRSFGFDVTASPETTTGFESCDAADLEVCQAGSAGAGAGQFEYGDVTGVAVDSTGAVYTLESSTNLRVQKFTPAGATLTPSIFAPALLSGTSFEDRPMEIAIGASDHLLAAKAFPAGSGTPPADNSEARILELSSAGALLDTYLANGGIPFLGGLAENPTSGRLYASANVRFFILAEAGPLSATVESVTAVGATDAIFHGEVNPGGVLGEHHFEYVADAQFQIDGFAGALALPDTPSGNSNSPIPVSRTVGDLDPSTLYHVRLVVKQSFGTANAISGETTFTTATAKPTVADFASTDASDVSASLYSRVIPNGQATTYFFEWGPTASYGNATPTEDAGDGSASVFASASVEGLTPGATYHYRLVATNASGTTAGPDHSFVTDDVSPAPTACPNAQFRTGLGAGLPECRAYEQVSPIDKNGGDIVVDHGSGLSVAPLGAGYSASLAGDRAIFSAETEFAGASSGGSLVQTLYIAGRGAAGWVTEELAPRVTPAAARRDLRLSSPDLSHSLLTSDGELQLEPPRPSEGDVNIYSRDNLTGTVSMWFGVPAAQFQNPTVPTSWDRVVFGNKAVLTTDPGVPAEPLKVYEKVEDQPVRLVSVLPDGTPSQTETVVGGRWETFASTLGAVSDDGSHVFFSEISAGLGEGIYRRSDGTTTLLVSPSKRTPPDTAQATGEVFQLATADGSRVLFTSGNMLTNDANTGPVGKSGFRPGNDLYRYDVETDELVDISATVAGNGAEVQGVLGADAEADRVYYAAKGEVLPGQGIPGRANIYLWEDDGSAGGTNRFIASVVPATPSGQPQETLGDSKNWSLDGLSTSRVTKDGRYLLFQTPASIPGGEEDGLTQVYRYDAEADGGGGELDCVSCNPAGETPIGPAAVTPGAFGLQYSELPRNLAEDGRVFFISKDALLPADTNGQDDVYAWAEGDLALISTGTSPRGSNFDNASTDGSSVFFYTADALVPQDGDSLVDLYDARVNGGLAAQFAMRPPECSGEECRGAGTQPSGAQAPLTSSFSGPGNRKTHRCPKGKRRIKTRNGRTRCVKKKSHKRHHRKRAQQNRAGDNRRAGR